MKKVGYTGDKKSTTERLLAALCPGDNLVSNTLYNSTVRLVASTIPSEEERGLLDRDMVSRVIHNFSNKVPGLDGVFARMLKEAATPVCRFMEIGRRKYSGYIADIQKFWIYTRRASGKGCFQIYEKRVSRS